MNVARVNALDEYSRRKKRDMLLKRLLVISGITAGISAVVVLSVALARTTENRFDKNRIALMWNEGRASEVFELTKESLVDSPVDPLMLSFFGYSSFYLGLTEVDDSLRDTYLDQTIAALRKAILVGSGPLEPENWYILGKAYFRKGDTWLAEAVECLSKAEAAGYVPADLCEHMGLALARSGNYADALSYFERATENNASDQLFLSMAVSALALELFDRAEAEVDRALDATKDLAVYEKAKLLKADLRLRAGDNESARREIVELLARFPESSEGHLALGLHYRRMKDEVRARAEFRKALEIDPMNSRAREELARRP